MSKVTLKTLKADFVRLAAKEWDLRNWPIRWFILRHIELECHNPKRHPYWNYISDELVFASRLYRIARQQGLNAAMLWKLSN